jgi:peptidoglycan hydrolase-like protein with peptidoglycan-binding domain
MHGHDVRVLQAYLSDAGFSTPVDGAFGAATKRNVVGFQRSHSMSADGIVTAPVVQSLRDAVAGTQASAPGGRTRINSDGTATAPSDAPAAVQRMVAAANQIIDKPYASGGGHGSWNDSAYDCSGAVSYVLHGAGMLSSPEDSSALESYGQQGAGHWVTIYANAGHTWIVIAGRAFDTANYGGPNVPSGSGPRWRSDPTGNLADGGSYSERHPAGL